MALQHDVVRDDYLRTFSHGYTTLGFLDVSVFFSLSGYLVAPGLVRWPWSRQLARADPSFGIYLLHGPVIVLILAYYRPESFVTLFLLAIAITIPIALASWFWLEAPALRHKGAPAEWVRKLARAAAPRGSR